MALGKVGELGNFIRDQRRNARLSLRKLSNMAGISNPYLSQIERGLRRPSAEILQAIARALQISSETMYVKAGILEERPTEIDLAGSIARDHALTEKQKRTLLEVYESFVHENELEDRATPKPAAKSAPKGDPKKTAKARATRKKPVAKPAARRATQAKPRSA